MSESVYEFDLKSNVQLGMRVRVPLELQIMGLPSIEFGPLAYNQMIIGLTPIKPTNNLLNLNYLI